MASNRKPSGQENMYTSINFKTKKALREHVAARTASIGKPGIVPRAVEVYQPNGDLTGTTPPVNGKVYLEGPHYPEPHRWYAEAWLDNGEVVKVK